MDDEMQKARTDTRSAFLVTRDCALALSRLSLRDRALLITAMAEYFLYGEVRTKLTKLSQNNFEIFKGGMDRDKYNFENKSNVRRENGRKGGIAKGKSPLYADNKGHGGDENNPEIAKIAKIAKIAHKQEQEQEQEHHTECVCKGAASAATLTQRFEDFKKAVMAFEPKYGSQMLEEFINTWGEPTPDKSKMRWELEKTWSLPNRLEKWTRTEWKKPQQKKATAPSPQGPTYAEVTAQEEERERKQKEQKKHAISYEKHLEIAALEKQGYACDDVGNILGVRKELEAQGWKFGPLGEIVSRPKG